MNFIDKDLSYVNTSLNAFFANTKYNITRLFTDPQMRQYAYINIYEINMHEPNFRLKNR